MAAEVERGQFMAAEANWIGSLCGGQSGKFMMAEAERDSSWRQRLSGVSSLQQRPSGVSSLCGGR